MRHLSEKDLRPSYEEQMAEYRHLFSKDLPPDGNLKEIPPDLFWEIVDFLAQQSREDLWQLIYKYTVRRTKWGKEHIPEDDKSDTPEDMLFRLFDHNSVAELYEFRDREIRDVN